MEADAALYMFKHLHETYDNKLYVEKFISDDDSSTRNLLCHPMEHKNGALPLDMASPTFLCDVGHRIKCMAKPFFSLANLSNRLSTCTKSDALRIKRNIDWCVRCYRSDSTKSFEDFVANAKAPVLHHFDDHSCCDASWCWKKDLDEKEFSFYKEGK